MWDWFISVDLIPFTDLELQYVLDSKKDMKTRRLFMVDHEGLNTVNKSVTVMKNRPWSHRFKVNGPHIPHWSVMASGVSPNKNEYPKYVLFFPGLPAFVYHPRQVDSHWCWGPVFNGDLPESIQSTRLPQTCPGTKEPCSKGHCRHSQGLRKRRWKASTLLGS